MTAGGRSDYSFLDVPEVLDYIFYPRPEYRSPGPPVGEDLLIPVEGDVRLGARFHGAGGALPTLLFFHGNGEIVADYDDLAPFFTQAGANFLPVDYRGYGRSSGRPTVSAMMEDCHAVFDFAQTWLRQKGYSGPVIAAGRSLGSASALELASTRGYPAVRGLFLESGLARVSRLLDLLGIDPEEIGFREEHGFRNLEKIRGYTGPTLIIHGEEDQLISVANAHALFEESGAPDKRLLVIPGADHNSVLYHGMEEYQAALVELAERVGRARG